MYLYHSDNTHYDLLVSENSRLALNLLTGNNNECKWNSVTKRKQKSKMDTPCSEKLLIEDDLSNKDNKDVEELEDEITLLRGKDRSSNCC